MLLKHIIYISATNWATFCHIATLYLWQTEIVNGFSLCPEKKVQEENIDEITVHKE